MKVKATYSPDCCKMLREGKVDRRVVHDGACRTRNGGELGRTEYLVSLTDICFLAAENMDKFRSINDYWDFLRLLLSGNELFDLGNDNE